MTRNELAQRVPIYTDKSPHYIKLSDIPEEYRDRVRNGLRGCCAHSQEELYYCDFEQWVKGFRG